MKKRWLAIGLTAAMITSMAACGGSSSTASTAESKPAESAATESKPAAESKAATESKTESKPAAAGDEGKVLNVEVWNDEFINRVTDHYPGYEKVSDTEG